MNFSLKMSVSQPRKIEGIIASVMDNGIFVRYKKPRKSKFSCEFFAFSKIFSLEIEGELQKKTPVVLVVSDMSVFPKIEKIGKISKSPVKDFVAVQDKNSTLLVNSAFAICSGEED